MYPGGFHRNLLVRFEHLSWLSYFSIISWITHTCLLSFVWTFFKLRPNVSVNSFALSLPEKLSLALVHWRAVVLSGYSSYSLFTCLKACESGSVRYVACDMWLACCVCMSHVLKSTVNSLMWCVLCFVLWTLTWLIRARDITSPLLLICIGLSRSISFKIHRALDFAANEARRLTIML